MSCSSEAILTLNDKKTCWILNEIENFLHSVKLNRAESARAQISISHMLDLHDLG